VPGRPDQGDKFETSDDCGETAKDTQGDVEKRRLNQPTPEEEHGFVAERGERRKSAEETGEKEGARECGKQVVLLRQRG